MQVKVKYIPKIYDFFEANSDKEIFIIAGGRGKGATWAIGNQLIIDAMQDKHFILCTREIKGTVDHSSRRTIETLIEKAGLKDFFIFHNTETICKITGSQIIYTGLSKITEDNVQGLEGVTRAWLGEAHTMEKSTWQKFEPTMRNENSKVYIDYNIQYSHTLIHALFTENPNKYPFEGKKSIKELAYLFMDYRENCFCPEKTIKTADRNKEQYSLPDWEWIWLGKLKDASDRYVCSDLEIRAAMHREVAYDDTLPLIVGCDIAHLGGDEIVFYKRRGYKFLDNGFHKSKLTVPQTCDELVAYIGRDRTAIIVIDNGHVGAAVADEMQKRGYHGIERVNFGGTKEMHFDPDHSKDAATDMAFNFAAMVNKLELPFDMVLLNQLSQRQWDFVNNKGIRKIESKDDFKKHAVHLEGHTSPDRGDAAWLCCYNTKSRVLQAPAHKMIKVW
jgi:PBSX family phage terminase large subunit